MLYNWKFNFDKLLLQAKDFIDSRVVRTTGGCGGDGCISFLHLFRNENAGPDGGDGGNGGHVIFKVPISTFVSSIYSFKMTFL